nr:MAG TPA: hypothetical protein [Caudoviricetes sp.]
MNITFGVCFFIAQERAQYRAEAHDMEVSEQWK